MRRTQPKLRELSGRGAWAEIKISLTRRRNITNSILPFLSNYNILSNISRAFFRARAKFRGTARTKSRKRERKRTILRNSAYLFRARRSALGNERITNERREGDPSRSNFFPSVRTVSRDFSRWPSPRRRVLRPEEKVFSASLFLSDRLVCVCVHGARFRGQQRQRTPTTTQPYYIHSSSAGPNPPPRYPFILVVNWFTARTTGLSPYGRIAAAKFRRAGIATAGDPTIRILHLSALLFYLSAYSINVFAICDLISTAKNALILLSVLTLGFSPKDQPSRAFSAPLMS